MIRRTRVRRSQLEAGTWLPDEAPPSPSLVRSLLVYDLKGDELLTQAFIVELLDTVAAYDEAFVANDLFTGGEEVWLPDEAPEAVEVVRNLPHQTVYDEVEAGALAVELLSQAVGRSAAQRLNTLLTKRWAEEEEEEEEEWEDRTARRRWAQPEGNAADEVMRRMSNLVRTANRATDALAAEGLLKSTAPRNVTVKLLKPRLYLNYNLLPVGQEEIELIPAVLDETGLFDHISWGEGPYVGGRFLGTAGTNDRGLMHAVSQRGAALEVSLNISLDPVFQTAWQADRKTLGDRALERRLRTLLT